MSPRIPHEPDYAFHPGDTLAETLDELGMTQTELAERTGRPLKTINEIIKGKADIMPETALQLERVTGVPAGFWNNAQSNYNAALARQAETEALRKDLRWLKEFPQTALWKLGWLPKHKDPVEQLRALLDFFGVAGIEEWQRIWERPEATFRKSTAFKAQPKAVAAWLREGERQAQRIATQPFDRDKFYGALTEIRRLTVRDPDIFMPAMKRRCAESGVALVFVPEAPGARVYGATRWLTPGKAILQLSLRRKAEDFLWFTFFHEAGHILRHGKRDVFIESQESAPDDSVRRKEEEADEFSADFLIPKSAHRELLSRKPYTITGIRRFASTLGIAPAIIVGRLQHDGQLPNSRLNNLKRRFEFTRPG